MDILKKIAAHGHEQVIAFHDAASGLRGFLAIHNTNLGPALGGVRILPYKKEEDALADALRLSRAMTYKCALAEMPAGGGKAVIIDHKDLKRAEAFTAFGRLVASLGGRFFTGGDVGITPEDLAAVRLGTSNVACESSHQLGDINEHTATGVWHGLRACLNFTGIRNPRVAIQGVGNVGRWLARILAKEGFEILLADKDTRLAQKVAKELGAKVVPPGRILSVPCDVLAPCALGGVINVKSRQQLKAKIICGAANNVLATPQDGDTLARRGILYAPDYLVNAGGVIRGGEFYLLKKKDSGKSLEKIYDRMTRVAKMASARQTSTARMADELAESRFQ